MQTSRIDLPRAPAGNQGSAARRRHPSRRFRPSPPGARARTTRQARSHPTQYQRLHELAHALGVGYRQYGRRQAEVLVDTVTYVVCGSVGLDVSGESVPYVAGWGEDGALEAIHAYAETIDQVAKRIETALRANEPDGSDTVPVAA